MIDFDKMLGDAMEKAERVANEVLQQYKEKSSAKPNQEPYTGHNLSTYATIGVAAIVIPTLCYKAFKYYTKTKTTEQYHDIPLQDFTGSHIDNEYLLGDHYVVV